MSYFVILTHFESHLRRNRAIVPTELLSTPSPHVFCVLRVRCVQGAAKKQAPGLVNSITALSYHFNMVLPTAITQPGDPLLAEPCMSQKTEPDRDGGLRKIATSIIQTLQILWVNQCRR